MIIRSLSAVYHRLFGSSALRKYEEVCLEAWRRHLPEEALKRLDRQMEAYNLVQRMSDDKLVCFYNHQVKRAPTFTPDVLFQLNSGETPAVASIYLRSPHKKTGAPLKADIILASGRFFGFEFNKSPKMFFMSSDLNEVTAEVKDVKIWHDPMQPLSKVNVISLDASSFKGWLRDWFVGGHIKSANVPLNNGERSKLLNGIDAKLSADYLELAAQVNGCIIRNCTVMDWIIFGKLCGQAITIIFSPRLKENQR